MGSFCGNCGSSMVVAGAAFCGRCGTRNLAPAVAMPSVEPSVVQPLPVRSPCDQASINSAIAIPEKAAPNTTGIVTMHWGIVLLFATLTFGIFAYIVTYYQWKYIRENNDEAGKMLKPWLIIAFVSPVVSILTVVLLPVAPLWWLILALKMNSAVENMYRVRNIQRQMSGAAAFFFTFLYIQYHLGLIARIDQARRIM